VSDQASGEFDVKLAPQAADPGGDPGIGRMTLDKEFRGDLVGTSSGQMLSAMGTVQGSAGYVAIERVTGTLKGRAGSFVLQHTGVMDRGKASLSVIVVPDSGTDQLTGQSGQLDISIEGKKHSYVLEYSLPEAPWPA
jgi:hypothetical protein